MTILKYVPPKKNIVDRRSENGGYYEAQCENCGTIFYPERSNAKYCSPNCGLIQHRKAKAEILAAGGRVESKPKQKATVKDHAVGFTFFRGAKQIYEYLKSTYNTRGDREHILQTLKDTKTGGSFKYKKYVFTRISPGKWVL